MDDPLYDMNIIVEVNWASQEMADGCIIVTPLLTCSSHLYNCQSMGKIAFGANVYTFKLLVWCIHVHEIFRGECRMPKKFV